MAGRTTVVLTTADELALRETSQREGIPQAELIRRGIRLLTSRYRHAPRPSVGWLKLGAAERAAIQADDFGDWDA